MQNPVPQAVSVMQLAALGFKQIALNQDKMRLFPTMESFGMGDITQYIQQSQRRAGLFSGLMVGCRGAF